MKKLIATLTFTFLISSPIHAATKPSDSIGIINIITDGGGAIEKSNKRYFKPWGQLKLDAKTKSGLMAKNKELDSTGYGQAYRLGFLFIIDDRVTRVLFYGDRGGIHMLDWPAGDHCRLLFDSNGGFAGVHRKACHDPTMDE